MPNESTGSEDCYRTNSLVSRLCLWSRQQETSRAERHDFQIATPQGILIHCMVNWGPVTVVCARYTRMDYAGIAPFLMRLYRQYA